MDFLCRGLLLHSFHDKSKNGVALLLHFLTFVEISSCGKTTKDIFRKQKDKQNTNHAITQSSNTSEQARVVRFVFHTVLCIIRRGLSISTVGGGYRHGKTKTSKIKKIEREEKKNKTNPRQESNNNDTTPVFHPYHSLK